MRAQTLAETWASPSGCCSSDRSKTSSRTSPRRTCSSSPADTSRAVSSCSRRSRAAFLSSRRASGARRTSCVDGVNGYLVGTDAAEIGERMERLAAADLGAVAGEGPGERRRLHLGATASRYLELAEEVAASRHRHEAAAYRHRSASSTRSAPTGSPASSSSCGDSRSVRRRTATPSRSSAERAEHMEHAAERGRGRVGPAGLDVAVLQCCAPRASRCQTSSTRHMTAADVAAVAARAMLARKIPIVATRHFAQRRGTLGPSILYRIARTPTSTPRSRSAEQSPSGSGCRRRSSTPASSPAPERDPSTRRRTVLVAQRLQPEKHTDLAIRAFAASGIWRVGLDAGDRGHRPDEHDASRRSPRSLAIVDARPIPRVPHRPRARSWAKQECSSRARRSSTSGSPSSKRWRRGCPLSLPPRRATSRCCSGFDDRALFRAR